MTAHKTRADKVSVNFIYETLTVLKYASNAAIYGARASFGVILNAIKDILQTYILMRNFKFYLFLALIIGINDSLNSQELKVMSYNIHIGKNIKNIDKLDSMANLIAETDPDIVFLQEVDSVCERSGNVDQTKFLAEHTDMYYSFVRHFEYDGGAYGQAVLSKYPISKTTNYRLPLYPLEDERTLALLLAEIEIPKSKKVLFGNAHLDYQNQESRLNQTQHIIRLFNKSPLPGILVGDMNAVPDSEELVNLSKYFDFPDTPNKYTFPAPNPIKKIDFIMVKKSSGIIITREVVLDSDFSDHKPLVSILTMGNETE